MPGGNDQRGLRRADSLCLDFRWPGQLPQASWPGLCGELFGDEDLGDLCRPDNGRPGASPSGLATALLVGPRWGCARRRANMDPGRRAAPGTCGPSAKSTSQLFRSLLIARGKARAVFNRSPGHARRTGRLRGRRMKPAINATAIPGRGAAGDARSPIGEPRCRMPVGALAEPEGRDAGNWASQRLLPPRRPEPQGLGRHQPVGPPAALSASYATPTPRHRVLCS